MNIKNSGSEGGFIKRAEKFLGVNFPLSYRNFISNRLSCLIDGFGVIGASTKEVSVDVVEGTEVVRKKRPDIPRNFVAILFINSLAVCLDLSRSNGKDAPLVEIELTSNKLPVEVGMNFSEWLDYHEKWEKCFEKEWNRAKNRQAESEGKNRIQDWSAPIFRVKDYIIGIGAFRYNDSFGCLEADAFLPLPQPHMKKDEPVKILLSEAFARARDYSGSLSIQFARDLRENENGEINVDAEDKRRTPAPVPKEILDLASKYSIKIPNPERGFIAHKDAVNLWFSLLEFPEEVKERIVELENAEYLKREIVAEIVSLGNWTKEEAIWIFLNAPRPEALVMGSDSVEDRTSYAESMNCGRAALIATRLKNAVMAEMNGGFTLEEIEEIKICCEIEPMKDFWFLRCTEKFYFPEFWLFGDVSKKWFEANEPVLLLCRPHIPSSKEIEMGRLEKYLKILVDSKESVQAKCLVLSNEYTSPHYCEFLDEIKNFVKKAQEKNIQIIFAPTRTDLYLDQEIQARMHRVKSMTRLPSRQEIKSLQIFEVPEECWNVPEEFRGKRSIQNASRSALNFAQQLVKKREVRRYEMEFSLMCEVIEREASQNHRLIAEIDEEESLDFLQALRHNEKDLNGISFSFVTPNEMSNFLKKIGNEKLLSKLVNIQGGIVAVVKNWEHQFISPKKIKSSSHKMSFKIPENELKAINANIKKRKENKIYASHWTEIDRAHLILRQSLENSMPFAIASMMGRVRSGVFAETFRDYIHKIPETKPAKLPFAYGDGSHGGPFPLFSLPLVERPKDGQFFTYNVGLVSLRHPESDKYTDRSLVRNRDIQTRVNATEQELLIFNKTYECLDELLRYIRGEIGEKDNPSSSLKILLGWKPELKRKVWKGLCLNIFHTSGLESAGVGAYRAVLEILKKYQGEIIVTPRILVYDGQYKKCEEWF